MKRVLALTATASVLASYNASSAAQSAARPVPESRQASSVAGQASETQNGWGNAPAAASSLRLAEPPVQPTPSTPAPARTVRGTSHRSHGAGLAAHAKGRARTEASGCANLPVKWAHAERLAESGRIDEAYGIYAQLLHTCSGAGELEGTAWKAAKALPAAHVARLLADPAFDTAALRKTRSDIELQQMYVENAAGHFAAALEYSRSLRADPSVKLDPSALQVSGWLEEQAHEDATAERLFRQALETASDPEPARQGLALALLHQGRLDEAQAESRVSATPAGRRLNAQIALARAKTSGDRAQVDAALALIDETGGASDAPTRALMAWALLSSARPARAQAIFRDLHEQAPDNEEYVQGLAYASAAARDYAALDALVGENKPGTPALAREALAEHDARLALYSSASRVAGHPIEGHEAALQAMMDFDRKSGTAGQDKLTVWTMPQFSATMLPTPTLTVQVDAALLRLDDEVRHAWGKQLAMSARTDWLGGEFSAGAGAQLPGRGPTQWLGKIQFLRYARDEDAFFRITAKRDGIYDSLRAYEGTPSGPGPAIASSLEMAAREPIGGSAWHVGESLAGGAVTASGTAFNPFYAASLGVTRDFTAKGWSWLNAGPEVRFSSYRYDANRFDGPYAGYWSPKSNREAGLVFNAQSEEGGRLLFKTGGRLGYAARQLFTGRASGAFGEDTTTIAALVAPNVIVGAGVGYRASPGYRDMSVFAWVKIPLVQRAHLRAADLVTPRGF